MVKRLFNPDVTPASVNVFMRNTMVEHLGIEVTSIGEDYIEAKMPVDRRTHQPYGLLHGGASAALAETLGSVAAHCIVDDQNKYCVGLEINANHIKSVKSGFVTGVAKPIHIGSRTHVWEIRITNEQQELVCISRLTMAVIDKR
ncbi:MAG TPA: hotdog fold thioesterase [Cyclobacteriaceae bacterium]|nr:hotdog fold thioesterase [Cyclobacteriaceae bacterium]